MDFQSQMYADRLGQAATNFDIDLFADLVIELLWSLVEARPDLEDFSSELAGCDVVLKAKFALCELEEASTLLRKICDNAILPLALEDDRDSIDAALDRLRASSNQFDFVSMAHSLRALAVSVSMLRCNTRRMPVMIENDVIRAGRHTTISFNRTLRVPEDGKDYPLPAGFGTLPIFRVEDYAEKVPPKWLEEGGFFIPLYQREALYLEFTGEQWRPTIAKVAVGRVNAVTGKAFDEQLSSTEQDYVVIPKQQWLDGINSAKGSVSQFVAMPLGQGYTVEEQVTDEAKHGGFQIMVCDPKSDHFAEQDPEETEQQNQAATERRMLAKQRALIESLPEPQRSIGKLYLRKWATIDEMCIPTLSLMQHWKYVCSIAEAVHKNLPVTQTQGFDEDSLREYKHRLERAYALPEEEHLCANERPMALYTNRPNSGEPYLPSAPLKSPARLPIDDTEMGIAAGGRITQNIVEDEYGIEAWDIKTRAVLTIHIVNSEHFQRITGLPAPQTPITREAYDKQKIPWFSAYNEQKPGISPAKAFECVKGIASLDKLRGKQNPEDVRPMTISDSLIKRIHTPTKDERVCDLERRMESSWSAQRYVIAHREATLLLELEWRHQRALQLRAECNLCLGRLDEADADASNWIDYWGDHPDLRAIRASANLRLGAYEMAKEDASSAITISPDHSVCLQVRAEVNLQAGKCGDAWADLDCLFRLHPDNPNALKLRAECHRQQGSLVKAIRDATQALIILGPDARALEIRANAYLSSGNPFDAKRDAAEALSLVSSSQLARDVLAQLPFDQRR